MKVEGELGMIRATKIASQRTNANVHVPDPAERADQRSADDSAGHSTPIAHIQTLYSQRHYASASARQLPVYPGPSDPSAPGSLSTPTSNPGSLSNSL